VEIAVFLVVAAGIAAFAVKASNKKINAASANSARNQQLHDQVRNGQSIDTGGTDVARTFNKVIVRPIAILVGIAWSLVALSAGVGGIFMFGQPNGGTSGITGIIIAILAGLYARYLFRGGRWIFFIIPF